MSEILGGEHATSRRGEIDSHEFAFIQQRASAGFSAQQVAKIIGRSVEDVRAVWPLVGARERQGYEPARHSEPEGRRVLLSLWRGLIEVAPTKMTRKEIIEAVARRHDMTPDELCGPQRSQRYARARWEAMWWMRQQGRWSLPQIGQALGKRDHTTVMHGLRRYEELLREGEAAPPTRVAA